ncbi:MAG: DUF2007 domain-containing protein [Actinomycetota bacterium]
MAGSEKVSTVYLGQYTEAHAEAIAKALEDAGIVWWQKGAGRVAKILFAGDWGVRLFVDEKRLDDARAIAKEHGGSS